MMRQLGERAFVALEYLLPHHALSRALGALARCRWPWVHQPLIRGFIRVFDVNLDEAQRREPNAYDSFNDFFTRALRPGVRPGPDTADAILCPADGTVSQCGRIRGSDLVQAKGHHYSLLELLGNDPVLAGEFLNGSFATVYLAPRDYHRVHMPVTGRLRGWTHVPGRLFSVNDTTARRVPRLFTRNERVVTVFDTEAGPLGVVLVGAMIVAGIETVFAGQHTPRPRHVRRQPADASVELAAGDELGRFLLGSTVIMLLPEGAGVWRENLSAGMPVRVGESLGRL